MSRRGLFGLCVLATVQAHADIVLDMTRIIYPVTAREVAVTLTNHARQPRLVQAWIDSGDPTQAPEDSDVPFLVTPPILRIEAGRANALRIVREPQRPPTRETVYWLNVLSIPPALDPALQYTLQLALRTRIKLFLRPDTLPGAPDEAATTLRWRRVDGQPAALSVHNPSAYHVTLSGLSWGERRNSLPPMIAPGQTAFIRLDDQGPLRDSTRVYFTTLDDYGRTRRHDIELTH